MSKLRNGVITLSYARSAGTGDQPVPGTVTSRRNSNRKQRLQAIQKRQEEDEKVQKQRTAQEEVAQILARKWAEEDRQRKKKKRRKEGDSASEEKAPEKDRKTHDRDRDRRRHRSRDAEEEREEQEIDEDNQADGKIEEERPSAGWVSTSRPFNLPREEEPAPPPVPAESSERASSSAAAASSGGSWTAAAPGGRFGLLPQHDQEDGRRSTLPGPKKAPMQPSGKVAGVFGLSDSDDERDNTRKELLRVEQNKRERLSMHAEARTAEENRRDRLVSEFSRPLPTPAPTAPAAPGPTPDLCQQLMKMAQWKRSCNGKRLPMPDDLKHSVAQAMGSHV